MQLHSLLLLAALLLSAATAAEAVWSDVIIAVTYNVSTVPYRVFNAPNYVYYLPDWRYYIDPNKGFAVAETSYSYFNFMAVPSLLYLRGLYYWWAQYTPYEVTASFLTPGHIVGGSNFTVNGQRAEPFSICGGRYYYSFAYWVKKPGNYNIWSVGGGLWFIDEGTCAVYAVVENAGWHGFPNYTAPHALVTVVYMPTGRSGNIYAWQPFARPTTTWLNGTKYLYVFRYDFYTIGDGWYIANYTRVPTVAMLHQSGYYGPTHFDALRRTRLSLPRGVVFITIGAEPGDGAAVVLLPNDYTYRFLGRAEVGYIANDTAGYFLVRPEWLQRQWAWGGLPLTIFLKRYDLVEITAADDVYTWSTRTLACPPYSDMMASNLPYTRLTRLDRAREFELCNNGTSTYYVGLYVYDSYTMVDVLKPGECKRFRWDGAWSEHQARLRFFTSPQNFCMQNIAFTRQGGVDFTYGYRYFLMPDGSLVRGSPISFDTLYEEMWRRLLQLMAQQHNETVNAIKQWLQLQANLTKSIEDYYKSLPKYQHTIRMESSTSVWLQSMLEVISKYTIPGMPPTGGGFAPAPLPGVSGLSAVAAAAAVATAWAASRRSLASAAFLAGFAILASSLFVYYLYGTSVAAGLIVAAVVLMSIGAAAAWFRKTED